MVPRKMSKQVVPSTRLWNRTPKSMPVPSLTIVPVNSRAMVAMVIPIVPILKERARNTSSV